MDGQNRDPIRFYAWRPLTGALLLGAALGFWVTRSLSEDLTAPGGKHAEGVEKAKEQVYTSIDAEDEKGFRRKGNPKAGEWLARFQEPAQTLELYRLQVRVRPTEKRRTLVLQPLGELNEEAKKVVEALREYAEIFFQLPARVEPPIELTLNGKREPLFRQVPLGNRHGTYKEQCDAAKILDKILLQKLPDDAVAYLGIAMEDLYVDDLNYVFGLGSFNKRVGVYSLCRYYPEFWGNERKPGDETLGLVRACKVLNHETGHMFSLGHCVFFECSMNGSNSLAETDAMPIHFCPLCHRKLRWNIGFDAAKRYGALLAYYKKYGMTAESEWMAGRLERWKQVAVRDADKSGQNDEPGDR